MKLIHTYRGMEVNGANARMRRVLGPPPEHRLELQQIPPTLTTREGQEKLADFIVHGHDGQQFYSREQIKSRIRKVTARIALKLAQ